MTSQQARDFIAKYPDALSYVKPSHLEELSPLLEVHIEAIVCRKDEFHDLKGSFAPKKETLDKFAAAAGIGYNQTAEVTRREGEGCYVGTAQAMLMGPDGKYQFGALCEYEFDADVRLEEMKLNGKKVWNNGQSSTRDFEPRELAMERIQFMKVGRQRANTGARSRATVAMLGMQTGFKDLFPKNSPPTATVTFLFSRIGFNPKNKMIMDAIASSMAHNTASLYGPKAAAALPSPESSRIVSPEEPGAGDYDPFAGESESTQVPATPQNPEVLQLQVALSDWLNAEIGKAHREAIRDALAQGVQDVAVLRDLLERTKRGHEMLKEKLAASGKA